MLENCAQQNIILINPKLTSSDNGFKDSAQLLLLSKCITLLIFIDLAYSEHEGTEMLAVFTYAKELGLEPGLNSPETSTILKLS